MAKYKGKKLVLNIVLVTNYIISFAIANLILLIKYLHYYIISKDDYKCNISELKKAD